MNTKAMIALYRYRLSVSKGEDKADALVRAIESVSSTFYEYAEIFCVVKAMI